MSAHVAPAELPDPLLWRTLHDCPSEGPPIWVKTPRGEFLMPPCGNRLRHDESRCISSAAMAWQPGPPPAVIDPAIYDVVQKPMLVNHASVADDGSVVLCVSKGAPNTVRPPPGSDAENTVHRLEGGILRQSYIALWREGNWWLNEESKVSPSAAHVIGLRYVEKLAGSGAPIWFWRGAYELEALPACKCGGRPIPAVRDDGRYLCCSNAGFDPDRNPNECGAGTPRCDTPEQARAVWTAMQTAAK